jgi:parallel beta-helix repeat protein
MNRLERDQGASKGPADGTTNVLGEIARSEATTRRSILARLGPAAAAGGLVALGQPLAAQAAVNDSLFDRGGAVFNVKAFGALGNGSTDDTAAINSAIAAAVSAQGGTVFFPSGNFVISSTLTLSTRGVHLIGAGRHATVISASAGFRSGDMILITNIQYCSVKHMTLSGGATFRTGGAGVHINGPSAGQMNEMAAAHWVQDMNMYLQFIGVLIDGPTYINYVDGIYMYPLAPNGFGIVVNVTDLTGASVFISNVYVNGGSMSSASQPEAAIRIQHVGDYTLRSFASILCRNGLVVDPSDNSSVNYGVQAGIHEACFFDTMSVRCIRVQPTGTGLVRLLQFTNCWAAGANNEGVLISGNVTSAQFTGCMFHANFGHGFSCVGNGQSDQRIFLDACEALGNDRSFIGGQEKAGFVFENTRNFAIRSCSTGQGYQFDLQRRGIWIKPGCRDFHIANNTVRGNRSEGIRIESGSTNFQLSGNIVRENQVFGVRILSTSNATNHFIVLGNVIRDNTTTATNNFVADFNQGSNRVVADNLIG